MCAEVGLDFTETERPLFRDVFSGAPASRTGQTLEAWATPYAVSVNGHNATSSPFGPWGYGDGRAMSIGEVVHRGQRWELQLKGAGRTPFARQFDGRAVLRSSVREFLASEAMHALGVPTTRALSLVASSSEKVARPWYPPPDGEEERSKHPPSCLVEERTAMVCRCAPSFLRVGHIELFALRRNAAELREAVLHAIRREYPHVLETTSDLSDAIAVMYSEFVERQACLVAEWLRVGYVQGNMNSDNCLLGCRTMDYGPFGFMEEYSPRYQPFTSDMMGNYMFARQPVAAKQNCATLAEALLEAVPDSERDRRGKQLRQILAEKFPQAFQEAHHDGCRRKLGLATFDENARALWKELLHLMEVSGADFTVLFRLLASSTKEPMDVQALSRAFGRGPPEGEAEAAWRQWLEKFAARIVAEDRDEDERAAEMKAANPKYIPRNWMLFQAYEAAERGDYAPVQGMLEMLSHPYEEQPEFEDAFFKATPQWAHAAGGLAFMS